ncbi:hypothetical protein RFI_02078 [Reticulomyxa filosa]|uniref:Uncharacterized protein n=1 Tax=Reticulomyxa filosa TaxID=46433 RepID=X6PAA9_RETFI|nr:hypothetical protein RFI_02078 [Reticulomyxa filosa]|eukprot:ETO34994.1 hypothetical protein RFI_02078 [Reticulomyxa filosa]
MLGYKSLIVKSCFGVGIVTVFILFCFALTQTFTTVQVRTITYIGSGWFTVSDSDETTYKSSITDHIHDLWSSKKYTGAIGLVCLGIIFPFLKLLLFLGTILVHEQLVPSNTLKTKWQTYQLKAFYFTESICKLSWALMLGLVIIMNVLYQNVTLKNFSKSGSGMVRSTTNVQCNIECGPGLRQKTHLFAFYSLHFFLTSDALSIALKYYYFPWHYRSTEEMNANDVVSDHSTDDVNDKDLELENCDSTDKSDTQTLFQNTVSERSYFVTCQGSNQHVILYVHHSQNNLNPNKKQKGFLLFVTSVGLLVSLFVPLMTAEYYGELVSSSDTVFYHPTRQYTLTDFGNKLLRDINMIDKKKGIFLNWVYQFLVIACPIISVLLLLTFLFCVYCKSIKCHVFIKLRGVILILQLVLLLDIALFASIAVSIWLPSAFQHVVDSHFSAYCQELKQVIGDSLCSSLHLKISLNSALWLLAAVYFCLWICFVRVVNFIPKIENIKSVKKYGKNDENFFFFVQHLLVTFLLIECRTLFQILQIFKLKKHKIISIKIIFHLRITTHNMTVQTSKLSVKGDKWKERWVVLKSDTILAFRLKKGVVQGEPKKEASTTSVHQSPTEIVTLNEDSISPQNKPCISLRLTTEHSKVGGGTFELFPSFFFFVLCLNLWMHTLNYKIFIRAFACFFFCVLKLGNSPLGRVVLCYSSRHQQDQTPSSAEKAYVSLSLSSQLPLFSPMTTENGDDETDEQLEMERDEEMNYYEQRATPPFDSTAYGSNLVTPLLFPSPLLPPPSATSVSLKTSGLQVIQTKCCKKHVPSDLLKRIETTNIWSFYHRDALEIMLTHIYDMRWLLNILLPFIPMTREHHRNSIDFTQDIISYHYMFDIVTLCKQRQVMLYMLRCYVLHVAYYKCCTLQMHCKLQIQNIFDAKKKKKKNGSPFEFICDCWIKGRRDSLSNSLPRRSHSSIRRHSGSDPMAKGRHSSDSDSKSREGSRSKSLKDVAAIDGIENNPHLPRPQNRATVENNRSNDSISQRLRRVSMNLLPTKNKEKKDSDERRNSHISSDYHPYIGNSDERVLHHYPKDTDGTASSIYLASKGFTNWKHNSSSNNANAYTNHTNDNHNYHRDMNILIVRNSASDGSNGLIRRYSSMFFDGVYEDNVLPSIVYERKKIYTMIGGHNSKKPHPFNLCVSDFCCMSRSSLQEYLRVQGTTIDCVIFPFDISSLWTFEHAQTCLVNFMEDFDEFVLHITPLSQHAQKNTEDSDEIKHNHLTSNDGIKEVDDNDIKNENDNDTEKDGKDNSDEPSWQKRGKCYHVDNIMNNESPYAFSLHQQRPPIILLANKLEKTVTDQIQEIWSFVSSADALDVAKKFGASYIEVSAEQNINLHLLFEECIFLRWLRDTFGFVKHFFVFFFSCLDKTKIANVRPKTKKKCYINNLYVLFIVQNFELQMLV